MFVAQILQFASRKCKERHFRASIFPIFSRRAILVFSRPKFKYVINLLLPLSMNFLHYILVEGTEYCLFSLPSSLLPNTCTNYIVFYCRSSGGWTLVNNIVLKMPKSFVFILENNWQAISNYTTGQIALTASALGDLKKKIPFNQLRFHCFKKIPGRTFHVVTMKNTRGDDVVKYFTAQTDSFPKSCGSFYSLPDDNSMLSKSCWRWKDGYWSAVQPVLPDEKFRLVDHVAYVQSKYHWISMPPRWECDDYYPRYPDIVLPSGGYWKVFVR